MPSVDSRGFLRFGVLVVAFAAVGVLMSRAGIHNPWFWDDLHWFRGYSLSELASTWHGTNDPQGIMVPGYRPLHAPANYLRYELFGESPAANRYFTVGSLAVAFSLLVCGLRTFGVSTLVGVSAAVLALTSKNLTYTYAWVSDGYQALNMAGFGGAVLALGLGLRSRRRPRLLLGVSVALWVGTLFLKDQALLLLPALVTLAFVGGAGGFDGLAARMGDLSFRSFRDGVTYAWNRGAVRHYVLIVSAIAVADAVARRIFVPEATPPRPWPRAYLVTLTETAAFPGSERLSSALAYSAIAVGVFGFTVLAARSQKVIGPARIAPWLIAMFAIVAIAFTALYGFQYARADLVFFPVFFYGIFLSASVLLLARVLRRRGLALLAGGTVVLAAVTVTASVRASIKLQQSMARWSIQTLARNYEFTFGPYADGAKIPAKRRAEVEADLARVGIQGRLRRDVAFEYLYCRASRDPAFAGHIPEMFGWGRQEFPPVRCGPTRG